MGNIHSQYSTLIQSYNYPSEIEQASEIELVNSQFYNGSAKVEGGAIRITNTNVTVKNCTFEDNHSEKEGGALFFSCDGDLGILCNYRLAESAFRRNSAA